ncbi:MAG: AAA family ATPase [Pseudomonadota bacterium]|nr:AAA family ATPase [Pseudomonadota bacterium]
MRIDRLDLIRFGKFADRSLDFPVAERDFHVIVGPNEAGKSTVRAAILDLLYGIPARSAHAFLHALPELQLGGLVRQGGQALEFVRIKANKATLRDQAGGPLPDSALDPFLGSSDRDFFAQMFGLNHERLVKGGDSILSASDDLGQVLFQSAAGIGNLGAVREALEAEAETLWSKRKSTGRAYYVAADDLERAKAALKLATVRTKDWAEAHALVGALDAGHAQARRDHLAIKARRDLLERVRRVKPQIAVLAEIAGRLAAHADMAELPATAARTLVEALRDIAAADAGIEHAAPLASAAQAAIAAIAVDDAIRALGTEVTDLNDTRLACRAHAANIALWQAEVGAQWLIAAGIAEQLGWDGSREEALRARMPSQAVQAELARLIRGHAGVQQQLRTAERAEKLKLAEIGQARTLLAALPAAEVPAGLKAALVQVQKLGDFDAVRTERQAQVGHREAAAEAGLAALGAWRCDEAALRAMTAPPADTLSALMKEELDDGAEARAAAARAQSLAELIAQGELAIAQFREINQPVSRDQVQQARSTRDAGWLSFKADPQAVLAQGSAYEKLVERADALADTRHDKVQLESDLQAKQQHLQRLQLDLDAARSRLQALQDCSAARAARWAGVARDCGLPELPYQSAAGWLDARKHALEAAQALAEARRAQAAHAELCESNRAALAAEMPPTRQGQQQGDAPLAVLLLRADAIVSAMTEAAGQRRTLARQIDDGEAALLALTEAVAGAGAELAGWRQRWTDTLALSDLWPHTEPGQVDGVLASIGMIEDSLAAMRKIRLEHIDKMQAELNGQASAARLLAERAAPELAGADADDIALALSARLKAANEAHLELTRQQAGLVAARARLDESMARRRLAEASLAPLFERSGAADNGALADAIERSDDMRKLRLAFEGAEQAIRDGGDGLAIEQLRAEADSIDMLALMGELDELAGRDLQLGDQLSEMAVKRQAAANALALIGGAADAACAEGQRQEALAQMADAVERYLKVHVGARLLKWSIDQYREIKQGPMLQRAGTIFNGLTLGSFERLTVDFESVPLKLQGRRPDGKVVDIAGMSEGTRDQLYLSLRLAALDMHLGQAHALPFIADDLFINFDDLRCRAGLAALGDLSRQTQVMFLTHNDHILPLVTEVFGNDVNIIRL